MNPTKPVSNIKLPRLLIAAGFTISIALAAGWSRPETLDDLVMPRMGLKSGELITIAPDQAGKSEMAITMDGQDYVIDYAYFSNRSENFRLMVQQPNGKIAEQQAATVSTIRGTLRGIEGSRVAGCITEDGCCAKIKMPSGEDCYIEPIKRAVNDPAFAGVHVVYSADDVMPSQGQCAAKTNLVNAEENLARTSRSISNAPLREAEISVDADFEYFSTFGLSIDATLAQMELIINIVNDQYESEIGMRHTINRAMVWTDANTDPYTTSDAAALVNQFRAFYQVFGSDHLSGFDADACHLFTGRNLNGGSDGIAFIGGACSVVGYALSEHQNQLSLMTGVVAHELGHNWGASHCSCPNHTMNPFLISASAANNFSDATIQVITNFLHASPSCLDLITPPSNDDWSNLNSFGTTTQFMSSSTAAAFTNVHATTEADEQDLETVGSSVWYSVVAPENGTYDVNTFGSDFDTQLYIYRYVPNGGLAGLQNVADNDDTTDPNTGMLQQSSVTFNATAGTRYDIRVGGARSSQGSDGSEGNIQLLGNFVSDDTPPLLLGDVDLSGDVNFSDIPAFIAVLQSGGFQAEADCDQNDVVNFSDIPAFIDILLGS